MSQSSPIPTLVVMARWPANGRCKRRLAADIGGEQAAIIQQRLTAHTFAVAKALSEQGDVDVQVAMSGVGLRSAQRSLRSLPPCTLVDQGRGTLGARMLRQIHHARFGRHNKPVIVIGTDLADLCQNDLLHAIQRLQNQPLVLGPSADGGSVHAAKLWLAQALLGHRPPQSAAQRALRRDAAGSVMVQRSDAARLSRYT